MKALWPSIPRVWIWQICKFEILGIGFIALTLDLDMLGIRLWVTIAQGCMAIGGIVSGFKSRLQPSLGAFLIDSPQTEFDLTIGVKIFRGTDAKSDPITAFLLTRTRLSRFHLWFLGHLQFSQRSIRVSQQNQLKLDWHQVAKDFTLPWP